jgi:hypothetical protein
MAYFRTGDTPEIYGCTKPRTTRRGMITAMIASPAGGPHDDRDRETAEDGAERELAKSGGLLPQPMRRGLDADRVELHLHVSSSVVLSSRPVIDRVDRY